MKMTDFATLTGARVTPEGYLVANVRTARIGTQDYLGVELDRPDLDTVTVYRDESEVFRKASLQTFGLLPVTDDHPADLVTADTARMVSVGTTNEEVLRDGEYLRIGIKLTDSATIRKVQDGKRELSVGYVSELVWGDGIAPDGTAYQARQTNIVGNHIAIVAAGRAGPMARIGDSQPITAARWGASPITDEKDVIMADAIQTRTVTIDGLSVITTDAGAQALEKLQKQITDAATAQAAAVATIAAKDEEIGTLKADAKKLTDAALTPEKMTQMVADRVALETLVKAIAPTVDSANVGDADLRKAAVASTYGDEMVKDAGDAEITGMFKALAKDIKPVDAFADGVKGGLKVVTNDAWGAFLPAKGA
jgi:hypothetical protein